MTIAAMSSTAIETLRSQLTGQVILPGETGYDSARMGFNLAMTQTPALIVVAQSAEDVAAAVRFARVNKLGVGMQSTGHGVTMPTDDAVLVLTSKLDSVEIDAEARTATVGAGVRWGMVLAKTYPVGLAPLLGSSPNVGVVGYTLGAGFGWLARKFGTAVDSVLYFDVVTPDGDLVRASETENSDLFWALRGGGGNFGIVVGLKFRLHPVNTVYGGNLYYPVSMASEVLHRYREWVKTAPDELTSSVIIMNYPPFPQVPEPLRGKSFIQVRGCYVGDVARGERLMEYWRLWMPPAIDDFKVMPFSAVAHISNDPVNPLPSFSNSTWLREITDDVADTLIESVPPHAGPPTLVFAEIRHVGNKNLKVADTARAGSNRDGEFLLHMIGAAPTPEAYDAVRAYTSKILSQITAASTGGLYLNFADGEEARQRTREGFTDKNFQRLSDLKARFDPENRFRHSYAIEPAHVVAGK